MSSYNKALATANKVGAANATDAGVMAQFCETSLQILVGAASLQLAREGAQKKGMTARDTTPPSSEPSPTHCGWAMYPTPSGWICRRCPAGREP